MLGNKMWEAVMARFDVLEGKIDALDEKMRLFAMEGVDKEKKNALRRQYYREKKAERERGRLGLRPPPKLPKVKLTYLSLSYYVSLDPPKLNCGSDEFIF